DPTGATLRCRLRSGLIDLLWLLWLLLLPLLFLQFLLFLSLLLLQPFLPFPAGNDRAPYRRPLGAPTVTLWLRVSYSLRWPTPSSGASPMGAGFSTYSIGFPSTLIFIHWPSELSSPLEKFQNWW